MYERFDISLNFLCKVKFRWQGPFKDVGGANMTNKDDLESSPKHLKKQSVALCYRPFLSREWLSALYAVCSYRQRNSTQKRSPPPPIRAKRRLGTQPQLK